MMRRKGNIFKTALALLLSFVLCAGASACADSSAEAETYRIRINSSIAGGSVTADKTRVSAGEDVVLTLKTNEGNVLEYVTVNGIEVSFYEGEYTLFSVNEDCVIDAKFVSSSAVVKFVTGTAEEIAPKSVVLYERVGELPVPEQSGERRFLGWYDAAEGGSLIKRSSVVKTNELVLYARWEIVSQEYLEGLAPYSITNTVYSSQLGAYGVSFHTKTAAFEPCIYITESADTDFSEADVIECEQDSFFEEYVSQGVIDVDGLSLVRGRQYLVRVGDAVTGVYSEPFAFTARKLTEGEAKFVFIADTQQDYHDEFYTEADGIAYPGGIGDNFAATVLKTAIAQNSDFDFIAHGGDVVNYGAEESYWAEMLGDLAEIMFEYPMIAAAGNHESPNYYGSGKFGLMNMLFHVNMPEFGTGEAETYVKNGMSGYAFSLDIGPLHFVVLNSNDAYYTNGTNAPLAESLSNAQLNWLRADLKANLENERTKFTVAMIHEGPMVPTHSANASVDHYKGLRGPLLKELRAGKTDLTIYGHNHYAYSSYPLDYDENAATVIEYSPTQTVTEKYAKIVTDSVSREIKNGTTYQTFSDYVSGDDGTICYGIGAGGPQNSDTTFPFASMPDLISKHVFYRLLLSTGRGCIPELANTNNNMYAYIKATESELTVETYALNFSANYGKDFAGGASPETVLADALLLKK